MNSAAWRTAPMHRVALFSVAILSIALFLLLAGEPAALAAKPDKRTGDAVPGADTVDVLFLGPTRPLVLRLRITVDGKPFREVWKERFDEAFSGEDRDHDGRLDLEEAAMLVREMNGALRDGAAPDLKSLAVDGKIDRAALEALVAKTMPAISVRRRAAIAKGGALALFPLLDTNGDRQLSAAELSAAENQLKQRDFDDDGVITAAELILDPHAIAAAEAAEEKPDAAIDDAPLVILDATISPDQIADRLLAHFDRDHDGRVGLRIPKQEIRLLAADAERLDADGDGALSRAELTAFRVDRPDLTLQFAMGRAGVSEGRSSDRVGSIEGMRVRKRLRGGYDLKLVEAEVAFTRNNRDPRQADLVNLRTYDRDNNGYIDASEATAGGIGKNAFAAMDVDGDGKVFKGEFTSFMTSQNEAAAARFQLIVTDYGQELFDVLDTEKDGILSTRELRTAGDILNTADKNGDGVLGADEIPLHMEIELVRGLDERSETAAAGGAAGPAVRSTAKASTSGPLWFRKLDRNNDGDVSEREFVGPHETFSRLDANHDGLIDRDEAERAGK